jgi:hypothetical protein
MAFGYGLYLSTTSYVRKRANFSRPSIALNFGKPFNLSGPPFRIPLGQNSGEIAQAFATDGDAGSGQKVRHVILRAFANAAEELFVSHYKAPLLSPQHYMACRLGGLTMIEKTDRRSVEPSLRKGRAARQQRAPSLPNAPT